LLLIAQDGSGQTQVGFTDVGGNYSILWYAPSNVIPSRLAMSVNASSTPYQDYEHPSIIEVYSGTVATVNVVLKRAQPLRV
jgi:hypothetical protein